MSIKLAYVCDHCEKSYTLSKKDEYVDHLKTHANKRMDAIYAKKLYKESKEIERKINSATSYSQIADIIKCMSATNMISYKVPVSRMMGWRRDSRSDLYSYRLRGGVTHINCDFDEYSSYVNFRLNDEVDIHILDRLIPSRSENLFSINASILSLSFNIREENGFIKKERIKFETIRKLKS